MPDPRSTRTVALINPLWIGHHPVFFGHFTGAFLRAGAKVIGLCPDPDAARREIVAAVGESMPDWASRVSLHRLPVGARSWFNGRFEGDPYHTLQRWRTAGRTLDLAEEAAGWRADLVYFPYIDSYLRFLPVPAVPDILIGRPWSGLYLRNHHHRANGNRACGALPMLAKGDALLRSRLCREIGVLDERFIEGMEEFTGKTVIGYPDVTDSSLPVTEPALTAAVRKKAAGRKIIGLIGLETRKGTVNMLRVALRAHELRKPWYFVFAGVFDRDAYPAEDLALIEGVLARIASGEIDSIHFDPRAGRIPTESDFNSLFSSFDIAWAAFENFQGSSGTLSKAGAFRIPCIATAGECIGRRLERYRVGLTIPEGDSNAAFEAVGHLLEGIDWRKQPLSPDYDAFNEAHSMGRFDRIVSDLVERL